MKFPFGHDYSIGSISWNSTERVLQLGGLGADGGAFRLNFIKVVDWDLSPLEAQNVLFEIRKVDSLALLTNEGITLEKCAEDALASGEACCFVLDPSVGLGGFIVAGELERAA